MKNNNNKKKNKKKKKKKKEENEPELCFSFLHKNKHGEADPLL